MKLQTYLVVISLTILTNCQKDFGISEVYVFENKSEVSIRGIGFISYLNDTIPNKFEVFNIPEKSDSKIYSDIEVSHRRDRKFFTIFPFNIIGFDSVSIFFDEKRKINYPLRALLNDCSVPNNLYCRGSYAVKEISSFEYEYTYTFTEEDYHNATPLVFGEGFVGSVWRCTEGAGLQEGLLYSELRFVSEGTVEGWAHLEEEEEPELYFTAFYTLEGETLTISEDGDSFNATLNEDYTGLLTNIDGEGECIFVKQ